MDLGNDFLVDRRRNYMQCVARFGAMCRDVSLCAIEDVFNQLRANDPALPVVHK